MSPALATLVRSLPAATVIVSAVLLVIGNNTSWLAFGLSMRPASAPGVHCAPRSTREPSWRVVAVSAVETPFTTVTAELALIEAIGVAALSWSMNCPSVTRFSRKTGTLAVSGLVKPKSSTVAVSAKLTSLKTTLLTRTWIWSRNRMLSLVRRTT